MQRGEGGPGSGGRAGWIRGRVLPAVLAAISLVALSGLAAIGLPAGPASAASSGSLQPRAYDSGGVVGFGNAQNLDTIAGLTFNSLAVGMATDPDPAVGQQGYWVAFADGGVAAQGGAPFYGSLGALRLQGPIVSIAATADGGGYWLVAMDGGVFAFGDAAFYGSMGGIPLNKPVVGMTATPDGKGYWLVASDGGLFAFGDAAFYGSMGGAPISAPVTAMASTSDGHGYWMVGADGGIFAFGDAPFLGSAGASPPGNPVVDMVATAHDAGYLMVTTDGTVLGYGQVNLYGSLAGGFGGNPFDVPPVAAIALTPDQRGYWLLAPDGWNYSFSNPGPPAGAPAAMIAAADSQVHGDPTPGNFCNPYGPCEEWCALFATWVWQQGGVPIPSYPFTGSIYGWAASHTGVEPVTAGVSPGDAVLYGTGPQSTTTSVHVGVVVQTWPDGAVITIEGDAGPGPTGSLAVVINGPYLPSDSASYNGVPIYAIAEP